jgi:hypothetical protein
MEKTNCNVFYSDLKNLCNIEDSIHFTHQHSSSRVSITDGNLILYYSEFSKNIYELSKYSLKNILEIREGNHEVSENIVEINAERVSMVIDSTMDKFKEPAIGIGYLTRMPTNNFHTGDRFIIRKTGDKIICAMVPTKKFAITHQNAYICKPIESSISATAICSLLSSSIMTTLYQDGPLGQKGRTMAQLRIIGLKNLPIPSPEKIRTYERQLENLYKSGNSEELDKLVVKLFRQSGVKI